MNNDLEQRIRALEDWKAERERQQITYPLDTDSVATLKEGLKEHFLSIKKKVGLFTGGASGRLFNFLFAEQDPYKSSLFENTKVLFTAATSDVCTIIGTETFSDGDRVVLATTNQLPDPLTPGTVYYVRDSTGRTFKLAATLGGAAIDLTNTGTGEHYIEYI